MIYPNVLEIFHIEVFVAVKISPGNSECMVYDIVTMTMTVQRQYFPEIFYSPVCLFTILYGTSVAVLGMRGPAPRTGRHFGGAAL